MCIAIYIAAEASLPLVTRQHYSHDVTLSPTWPREAQRFYTAEPQAEQEAVRSCFSLPHVLYAGSYEGCGCGFNYGREYPEAEVDPEHLLAARESVAQLVQYVKDWNVREIYCSESGGEMAINRKRTVTLEQLAASDFVFGMQELLTIDHRG